MSHADDTRVRILHAAYRAFYREGFLRVSVDSIAEAAGVTKRTLYNHYQSKDSLIAAALAHHNEESLRLVLEWGANASGGPAGLIKQLFDGLAAWAAKPRWLGSGYTRVSMELADLPGHPARLVAGHHKRTLEAWLTSEFERLGARRADELARQVMIIMEGSMLLTVLHGDPGYMSTASSAASRLAGDHRTETASGRSCLAPTGGSDAHAGPT